MADSDGHPFACPRSILLEHAVKVLLFGQVIAQARALCRAPAGGGGERQQRLLFLIFPSHFSGHLSCSRPACNCKRSSSNLQPPCRDASFVELPLVPGSMVGGGGSPKMCSCNRAFWPRPVAIVLCGGAADCVNLCHSVGDLAPAASKPLGIRR